MHIMYTFYLREKASVLEPFTWQFFLIYFYYFLKKEYKQLRYYFSKENNNSTHSNEKMFRLKQ